jgi:hypothetical protein
LDLDLDVPSFNLELNVVPVHLFGTIIIVSAEMDPDHSELVIDLLRAKNENGEPIFMPKLLKKAPISGFEKVIWKNNFGGPAADVYEDLRECPRLREFSIVLLDPQPMDFIATDANILNLVRQLQVQGRTIPPDKFLWSAGRTLDWPAQQEEQEEQRRGGE